jgi:uncharacterized protein
MDVNSGVISADERRLRLTSEAERIANILAEEGASLVVAFGSYARGEATATSDLDVLAVLPTGESFPARHLRLYEKIAPRVAVDLIVYTPEEFEEIRKRSFIREALEHGRVLHAA